MKINSTVNRILISLVLLTGLAITTAKEKYDPSKNRFKQMGSESATPNAYRTALDAPGQLYWQQQTNYGAFDSTRISKIENTYDSYGNLKSEASYSWALYENDWIILNKDEYTYDSNGNQILGFGYYRDSIINKWLAFAKYEYAYNSNGNQTLHIRYSWNSNVNDWVFLSKNECDYDSNGNRTLRTSYTWDSNLNDWRLTSKEEDTYDSEGNVTLSVASMWDSNLSDWVGSNKSEPTYDSNGNVVLGLDYNWDSNLNDWSFSRKRKITYDSKGNQIFRINYNWDSNLNDWVLSTKSFYYYDSYNYFETDTICSSDSILWQGEYYDTEGVYYANYLSIMGRDSIYELHLTVNPNPSPFTITDQNAVAEYQTVIYSVPANAELEYYWVAENGSVLSYPSENTAEIQWGALGEGAIYGIAENQYGCKSDTSTLKVTVGSTDINDILKREITIYPNPAKDLIFINTGEYAKINGCQLKIINQFGSLVFETNVDNPLSEIDLQALTGKGLYFIQLIDKDGSIIETKKILLQ